MKNTLLIMIAILIFLSSCGGNSVVYEEPREIISEKSSVAVTPPVEKSEPKQLEEEIEMLSAEEYADIRALVPYEGLRLGFVPGMRYFRDESLYSFLDEQNETDKKILQYVDTLGLKSKEILSVRDLNDSDIFWTSVWASTPFLSSRDADDLDGGSYFPELEAINTVVSNNEYSSERFWLKEHIEQSAKLLFGEDVEFVHSGGRPFVYDEIVGVYYLIPMGWDFPLIPFVLAYEDLGDSYRVDVAYAEYNELDTITGEKLTEATRYHLYLLKQNDLLVFQKQVLAPR